MPSFEIPGSKPPCTSSASPAACARFGATPARCKSSCRMPGVAVLLRFDAAFLKARRLPPDRPCVRSARPAARKLSCISLTYGEPEQSLDAAADVLFLTALAFASTSSPDMWEIVMQSFKLTAAACGTAFLFFLTPASAQQHQHQHVMAMQATSPGRTGRRPCRRGLRCRFSTETRRKKASS